MKTIYNIKALCVMALLGSVATVSAQEDKTKEKNLNREMTLSHNFLGFLLTVIVNGFFDTQSLDTHVM